VTLRLLSHRSKFRISAGLINALLAPVIRPLAFYEFIYRRAVLLDSSTLPRHSTLSALSAMSFQLARSAPLSALSFQFISPIISRQPGRSSPQDFAGFHI